MQKNGLFVFLILVGICLILSIIWLVEKHESSSSISGGGYHIFFENEVDLSPIHVCIGCPPDVYEDLPVPDRDGYIFDGWYYDSSFKRRVDISNTFDMVPRPIRKIDGSVIGFQDIHLYAKWLKKKTY